MEARAADGRYCDIVLKGGITSGIVYPFAISRLSEQYNFQSIGGTSAGAVAAAAAAAAELQYRQSARMDGFAALDLLPNQLSVEDERGHSRLFRLFQPQAGTRPLFNMLIAALGKPGMFSRATHAIARGLLEFWPESALGALLFGLVSCWAIHAGVPENAALGWTSWIPIALLALVGAFLGLAAGIYLCLTRQFVGNGFGLCRGMSGDGASARVDDELTAWLHSLVNECAGRSTTDKPLTFGDLWSAPGAPPALAGRADARSIDLQMITTNVTHGRPYRIPFDDPAARLFFRPDELSNYFPGPIVQWMKDNAGTYQPNGRSDPETLPPGLLPMPDAANLPVVVATRLSLSYPLLISAVPLWAIDYEARRGLRTFQRCWFSDGGLSSNFPVHLFDDLLPEWPTFGMKLEDFPKGYNEEQNRIYMPFRNVEGSADAWNRFDDHKGGLDRIKGFASALLDSAMNWQDNVLSRLPGNRDRIVRIRLREDEGGMNLNMGHGKISQLSDIGNLAARKIVDRFVNDIAPLPDGNPMGWENHRWIRLRVLMALLEETMPKVQHALTSTVPGAPTYDAQASAAQRRDHRQYPLSEDQVETMLNALRQLSQLADTVSASGTESSAPTPLPELKVRPRL